MRTADQGHPVLPGQLDHLFTYLLVPCEYYAIYVRHLRGPDSLEVCQPGYKQELVLLEGQDVAHQVGGESIFNRVAETLLAAVHFAVN